MRNQKSVLGLCEGRHILPTEVTGFIFPQSVNPTDLKGMETTCNSKLNGCDYLELYVTGLTVALTTVINYCCKKHIALILWHYDRDNNNYYCQPIFTQVDCDLLQEAGYLHNSEKFEKRCM
jgi:hypothetical protein